MLDEHGMPVPPEHIPIPLWIEHEQFVDTVRDADDQEVNLWDSPKFFVHAANWIIPCREIVRRLADWDKKYPKGTIHCFNAEKEHDAIATDAEKLWAEMQQEAKGGEDNGK